MTRHLRQPPRRRTPGYVVAALAALVLLLVPSPAQAHSSLISSDPVNGAVLAKPPTHATFRFDESVALGAGAVQVFDATGHRLRAPATARDTTVTVALPAALARGTYTVVWRVVSADGHPVAGSLSFSVGRPSRTVTAPDGPGGSPRSVAVLLAVNQALLYLGLFTAAGLAVFATWTATARPLPRRRALRRTAWGAGAVSLAGGVLAVPLTVVQQRGQGLEQLVAGGSWTGGGAAMHLGLAAVFAGLVLAVVTVVRRDQWPPRVVRSTAVLAVLVPACGLSLTGHSRAATPEALVMAVDVLHVVAGSAWIGGLVGLVLVLPRSRPADRAGTLSRFSAFAAGSVALLVLTGLVMAWRVLGTWELLASAYGRLLLAKVDLVLVALAYAAVNRGLIRSGATAKVGREVRVEAGLLVAVLALTAVLVNQSPRTLLTSGADRAGAASAELGADHRVQVALTPARVGPAQVVVELEDDDGKPVEPRRDPVLTLRAGDTDLGEVPLTDSGTGTWVADVVVPTSGAWTAQVSLRITRFDNPVARVPLTVAPAG
ncbi:transport integral membrane protein [Nocardioides phosphati]|uniref:Transport integral membrane protein n=1 Tax=Nocardioides phosphati TaxID=1867775 RepID=A0ABQ2NAG2_9ACTN|nr:copper resistance protein CopC [Nocardioides phosphati]GGO88243.1 transport integral membrane protein [Nocardioides phosphati]